MIFASIVVVILLAVVVPMFFHLFTSFTASEKSLLLKCIRNVKAQMKYYTMPDTTTYYRILNILTFHKFCLPGTIAAVALSSFLIGKYVPMPADSADAVLIVIAAFSLVLASENLYRRMWGIEDVLKTLSVFVKHGELSAFDMRVKPDIYENFPCKVWIGEYPFDKRDIDLLDTLNGENKYVLGLKDRSNNDTTVWEIVVSSPVKIKYFIEPYNASNRVVNNVFLEPILAKIVKERLPHIDPLFGKWYKFGQQVPRAMLFSGFRKH